MAHPAQASKPDTLIAVVLQGDRVPATQVDATGLAMPAFADTLNDADVARLVSYIRNVWGNRGSSVSVEVHDLRSKLSKASH